MNQFYVATAIPYVNAQPHLGHALLFTYGDVLARYQRQLGRNVVFSIGTDEHGGKVYDQALNLNLDIRDFVDQNSRHFKIMAEKLQISYSHFIRTTNPSHIQAVQSAWQKMSQYIYQDTYEGWYCQGCEDYKTPTTVKDNQGQCPDHKQAYKRLKETNYFFKLSVFADRLKILIEKDQLKIVPQVAKNEILSFLNSGLEDISISRPTSSLKWGIHVPGDDQQIIYVWFDALLNYITVLDYPDGSKFKSHWPADVQIIGRDILRFHAVIWPAMLLALNLPVYKQLYVHGLVTVDGQKMSKTLGNVVDPLDLVNRYGLDAFRYFFLRHLPAYENGDYSQGRFLAAYNNELVDQLGNLIHRLQNLIWQKLDGKLPDNVQVDFFQPDLESNYHQFIAKCRFDQALNLIFKEIKELNRYLELTKPWSIDNQDQVAEILNRVAVNLKDLQRFLNPFLPETSQIIAEIFQSNPIKVLSQPPLTKIS
ncbi:MAG: methionine--tRNA ligase [Candidatus Saccharibacteria bacterium]|nr:methionine--tRNA ligase [Candidatus Saccharibacteria bacterium]